MVDTRGDRPTSLRRKSTTQRLRSSRDRESDATTPKRPAARRQAISSDNLRDGKDVPLTLTPKTEEATTKLLMLLEEHPLFEMLDKSVRKTCIEAMSERAVESGTELITQGDAGDHFYVVVSGVFDAYDALGTGKVLQTFDGSGAFGELALLYDSPRACSVRCTQSGTVYVLERHAFRQLVMQHNSGVKHGLEKHLVTVPILSSLEHEQLAMLADVMETVEMSDGEYIVQMGDEADCLFLILSGEVVCHKHGGDKELVRLQQGDFFGESALQKDGGQRLANVVAVGTVRLAVLKATDVDRILGSLTAALLRNFNRKVVDSVALLDPLSPADKAGLLEELQEETYAEGSTIISQGDVGTKFYIIKSGKVDVFQQSEGSEPTHVATLAESSYFGERALLTAEARVATVVTKETTQLMTLDKQAFERVLGPLQDLIAREVEQREAQAARATRPPILLDDLKAIAVLGEGSFGRVQLVVHGKGPTAETYALKSIYKGHLVRHKQVDHVVGEKRVLAGCMHPFVLRLEAVYNTKQQIHMLLEVALGGELFTRLRSVGRLAEPPSRYYTAMVASAFSYLHARSIAHRDLKPENLLFDSHGYLKLIDFGFAKVVTDRTWTLCGTPEYLAPEIISNAGHNIACDWWTLGILLYEMLVGQPPFCGDSPVITYQQIMRGKYKIPLNFPKPAKSLISQLLVHQPGHRLGCGPRGARDVLTHEFLAPVNFHELEKRTLTMPFVPDIRNSQDTSNFEEYPDGNHVGAQWQKYNDPKHEELWGAEFGTGVRC